MPDDRNLSQVDRKNACKLYKVYGLEIIYNIRLKPLWVGKDRAHLDRVLWH